MPKKDVAKISDFRVLLRILKQAKPYKIPFILAVVLAFGLAPLSSVRPYLINQTIDLHIITQDIPGLWRMIMLLVGLLFADIIVRYVFIYTTNWIGQQVIKDLRNRVFRHIISLRMSYFDRTPVGTTTTRTINDIQSINEVFSQGVITILADLLSILSILYFMSVMSIRLTLICLLTMPLMIIATYVFKEKVKVSFQTVRNQIAKMNAFVNERLSGMSVIKIFNAEKNEQEKFKHINRKYTEANLDAILYYALFYPVVEIISAIALALMVWWGARGVLDGVVSIGALIAFPLYISKLFRPLRMLADRFNTLQMGMVAGERVFKLLDQREVIQNNGTHQSDHLKGHIVFDKVGFSYDGNIKVLDDISFELNPGQTLAVVGSTGSGKSTLINVLNRYYEFQEGQIFIDGIDIREYDLASLRSHIGTVMQDVFLFSGTVMDNLRLNDESIPKETIVLAAQKIGAHQFIMELPGGYDYVLSERGANLSLGQRQLLSFIRFLVFDPDIMILDEATSSIDPSTEMLIQNAIEHLIAKKSSIIIAHRLTTIRHADKVAVLDKGRLVEFGTHTELLSNENGHFRKLYDHQFREEKSVAQH